MRAYIPRTSAPTIGVVQSLPRTRMLQPLDSRPHIATYCPSSDCPRRPLFVAVALFLFGLAAIPLVDDATARADFHDILPRFGIQLLNYAEQFGDGTAVVFIFAAVWTLDHRRRRSVVRLVCATWGAGIVANFVKLFVGRARPHYWLAHRDDATFEQFTGWFPLGANGSLLQSFPSAHTATAFGLALGLAALYPHARKFFFGLAVLTAAQRVTGDMHYVSDTLVAAGLAWCVAHLFYGDTQLARRFTAWERRSTTDSALPPVMNRAA